jgi:O-antigen/teichoic acid export membrane protein
MLSLMKGDTAVGLYNAAYRLSEISTVIPAIFMTSMFPVLSRFHKKSKDSFIIAYGKSIKYLFYLALPMAMVVTLLSKPIINLIFGAEFSGSIVALQILIWAAAIMYVSMVQGNTIISANKQMFCFKVTVFSAILNIILNLILIPRYSYIGASATTVATECFGFFIGIFFLFRWGYRIDINNIYLAPLFGLGIAGIISIILIQINVNILITSLVFILIYASILYKIGIKEDDKELIKKVINISKFKS